jgi:DNA helicase II / ATP-dependent DNA helicase PcrA
MITAPEFVDAVTELALDRRRPNDHQVACVEHPLSPALMIVAGPGSGKTTVLVMRALKHVVVDGVPPEKIVITTFTKKAAAEIRSRLISWGIPLFKHFEARARASGDNALAKHLSLSDVNAFTTGTLDSLCEQWTGRMRQPGEIPPVMIETFAARQIFSRQVFGEIYRDAKAQPRIDAYLSRYTWEQNPPSSQGEAVETAKLIIDRLVQDVVNLDAYAENKGSHAAARKSIAKALTQLHSLMRSRGQYDFALLEAEFLRKLSDTTLRAKLDLPRVLLIDEYQDTNPLQEAIYFALAGLAGASVTIVGDDDQALYRFRGATVELFRDFSIRFKAAIGGSKPAMRYLVENYRSTEAIVDICNRFISNDPQFAGARVTPPKPAIVAAGSNRTKQIPILGMFRTSPDDIARDLAQLLVDVFRNGGYPIPGTKQMLRGAPDGGDVADAVILAHSVAEFARPFMGRPGKARLPWLLRQELDARNIPVFNPRGRALKDILEVRQLLGLVALCIDGDRSLLDPLAIYGDAKREIAAWRVDAETFVKSAPVPSKPHSLAKFVSAWQKQKPQAAGMREWPHEWPILDLLYKLVAWLPKFQNLPEYQVYLEALTRSVTQATAFSPYQGRLMRDDPHATRSRQSALRDVLAPIAENLMEVDEELLTHLPRNHVNVMTIHQSKGLEFPLVIVDIGADFSRDHPKNRFKRFPDAPSNVTQMEDDLAPYTGVGPLRTRRTAVERTFEDLIRLYYVAYSRAQSALLLVGHTKLLAYSTTIQNVATFWQQGGVWPWQVNTPRPGRKPPASVSGIGIVEI